MIHLKKYVCGFLSAAFLFCSTVFPTVAKADGFDLDSIYEPYFILVDADNPSVALDGLEREADLRIEPASTTKILSCIVAIEQTEKNGGSLSDMASVSANAVDFGRGNSLMGLKEGDSFPLIDLLYGMMLPSGNDAAIAIAEHVAGSTKDFAQLMNAKAAELGMSHSHFVTVHGKHNSDHYSTVRDMAILTAYALKNETFCKIVSTRQYTTTGGTQELTVLNSNRMLIDAEPTETMPNPISCLYPYAIGVKTGDTTQAGKCLVAAARKEGVTLIAVLFGGTLNDSTYNSGWKDGQKDKYNAYRFQDAAKLFEYEYGKMERTVTLQELKSAGFQTDFSITIPNAIDTDPNGGVLIANADLTDTFTMQLMEPKMRSILQNASSLAQVTVTNSYAPISAGSVVGRVDYIYNNETLLTVDLIASRNVKEGMAHVSTTNDTPQMHTGGLIAQPNRSDDAQTSENRGGFTCGNMHFTTKQTVMMVLIPFIAVVIIIVIVMFLLYLRAERIKAEKRRRRAAARRRAERERNRYYE